MQISIVIGLKISNVFPPFRNLYHLTGNVLREFLSNSFKLLNFRPWKKNIKHRQNRKLFSGIYGKSSVFKKHNKIWELFAYFPPVNNFAVLNSACCSSPSSGKNIFFRFRMSSNLLYLSHLNGKYQPTFRDANNLPEHMSESSFSR
jgi:hypothetical protein